MKDFEDVVDEKKAEEDAERMLKGQFTLLDFLKQIQSIKKMGPLQDLVEKLPFMQQMNNNVSVDDRELIKVEAIINSMTAEERTRPDIIKESRKKRIARGSGSTTKQVTDLLKKFTTLRKMMKNMGRSGLLSKISSGLSGIPGMGSEADNMMPGDGMPPLTMKAPRVLSASQKKKQKSKRKKSRKDREKGKKKK
jgi:signal recognition particle subunit SRP54